MTEGTALRDAEYDAALAAEAEEAALRERKLALEVSRMTPAQRARYARVLEMEANLWSPAQMSRWSQCVPGYGSDRGFTDADFGPRGRGVRVITSPDQQ